MGNTQWARAQPYHDVLLEAKAGQSEIPAPAILSEAVETFWRGRYEAVFGEGSLDGFSPGADGCLTRGDYLRALFEYRLKRSAPAR